MYFLDGVRGHATYIGWLSKYHDYSQGQTTPEFQDRLELFCQDSRTDFMHWGFHTCDFCGNARGNGEMRAWGDNATYAAPVMVHHYVVEHHYLPPPEFIAAVLASPLPGTDEFERLMDQSAQEHREHLDHNVLPKWMSPREKSEIRLLILRDGVRDCPDVDLKVKQMERDLKKSRDTVLAEYKEAITLYLDGEIDFTIHPALAEHFSASDEEFREVLGRLLRTL